MLVSHLGSMDFFGGCEAGVGSRAALQLPHPPRLEDGPPSPPVGLTPTPSLFLFFFFSFFFFLIFFSLTVLYLPSPRHFLFLFLFHKFPFFSLLNFLSPP